MKGIIVSVIVAVYDTEAYVGQCINSIVRQTYKNLEIILVDDGSSDGSPEICDRYAAQDTRITVVHQTNKGLSGARNTGLEKATGEFIYFVDGDDLISEMCIETLVSLMEEHKADIVQSKTYAFIDSDRLPPRLPTRSVMELSGRDMCKRLLFGGLGSDAGVVWNKLYDKRLFDGIRFVEGMAHDDDAFIHNVYWRANKIVVLNQPYAYYRSKRQNSITHSNNKYDLDQVRAMEIRNAFFRDKKDKTLYEQSQYLLANTYTKYRANQMNKEYAGETKQKHRWLVGKLLKSGIRGYKKLLIVIGYFFPWFWAKMQEIRRFFKTIYIWKDQSFKIMGMSN